MNKKYDDGTYYIDSNFDVFSYLLNTNYTNNNLTYTLDLFPYVKMNFLNSFFVFNDNLINSYKLNFYYSFQYSNNIYKIYDCYNDYEDAIYYSSENNYTIYKSMSYLLYVYQNDSTKTHKLIDRKTNTEYLFYNNNYPYQINYYNTKIVYISVNNNVINYIKCSGEEIYFSYDSNVTTINYKKTFNTNEEVMSAKTIIDENNQNDIELSFYIYQYDEIEEDYIPVLVSNYEISYSLNILNIINNNDNTNIKFYYTNNKITKIEKDKGNLYTTNISYNSNITTLTEYENNVKLYYDSNNMIKYYIKNDKFIKFFRYNTNFLLEYESELLKNESIISGNLLSFDIIPYEPDEDDEEEYSFDVIQVYNQNIPTILNSFISSNDIFHVEGRGDIIYDKYIYGESDDDSSLLSFLKIISGYVFVELLYYGDDYYHTSITKLINNSDHVDYAPYVIGLKPSYSYDRIRIRISIDGEIYLTTPKLSNTHMGIYYSYNEIGNITRIENKDGLTKLTYDNDNLVKEIETDTDKREFERDYRGNIVKDTIDGFIINRSYEAKNRISAEASADFSTHYSYYEGIVDGIYRYSVDKIKYPVNHIINPLIDPDYFNYSKQDNCGRNILNKDTYTINNQTTIDEVISKYDGINKTDINHNSNHLSFSYNNDKLIEAYDNIDTKYNYIWQNNQINDVKYNTYKYVSKKTYDNRDRIISEEFNGIYTYNYLLNPKKIQIYYNNNLKSELLFNNYDLLTNDGYNNYLYDDNSNIIKNTILNYEINYYKNSIGYNDTTTNLFNYTYNENKYGDAKLKEDDYYSNITFNNDSTILSINSSNTTIMKYEDEFYPMSSNLLSITGNSPKNFTKQEYRLFYYDKDINNYATLLYGTKIRYDTNILDEGQIELEFKLENRYIRQLIIELRSNYRHIYLYASIDNELIINNQYENIEVSTTCHISSNTWYKLRIEINSSNVSFKIRDITNSYYSTYNISYTLFPNETNFRIQLGKINSYSTPMITFGLIRNLFYSNTLSDRDYINIYKSNSLMCNNDIKNIDIKVNSYTRLNINRNIYKNQQAPHNTSSLAYEKRNITIDTLNSYQYILDTYMFKNICYENHIKLNTESYYSYLYDTKERIIRENVYSNNSLLYYYEYTYDSLDNILSVTKRDSGYNIIKKVEYKYDNQYKMLLTNVYITEYNQTINRPITYDNQTGMLITSFMGNNYLYEGKRLISYNGFNYDYNISGNRIRKVNNNLSIDYRYYYDKNNNLLIEDRGYVKIKYLYDTKNELYGFIYDTSNNNSFNINIYFYIKDETGIIRGIADIVGNLVGEYEYNAYGLITYINQISDTLNIMYNNPIRYKSYYYDSESNMYYLKNRYYDPFLERFIIPDNVDNIDIEDIKTYNLYSYCYNNPTSFTDSNGSSGRNDFWNDFWNGFHLVIAISNPAILPTVGGFEFVHDLIKFGQIEADAEKNPVDIVNSYKIHTPMAQYVYSFYLNYINNETKDLIDGTSFGVQFEWMCHNVAYYVGYKKENATPVNIGPTIFDDDHKQSSTIMKFAYGLLMTPFFIIDAFIRKKRG